MLNAISVEKYAFIVEQGKALEKVQRALASEFRQELKPGGEPFAGYIHEVKLSILPTITPKLDYRAELVDAIGEEAVRAKEAQVAGYKPDFGTPRLLVGNIMPAAPDNLRKVGAMYEKFKKELFD